MIALASGCAVETAEEEDVDTDEAELKTGGPLANPVGSPAPGPTGITETVSRSILPKTKRAIYVNGGGVKVRPRAVLAVRLDSLGDERLHLMANLAFSRCNKDDVTGNGGKGSPCTDIKKTWGSKSYPYDPFIRAYFQLSDGQGKTKKVGKGDSFKCTEEAHHCPLDLATEVDADPAFTFVELVVEADGPSVVKKGDLVELEPDSSQQTQNGVAKSSLHVFRIGRDHPAPALVGKPGAITNCGAKVEVKTNANANGAVAVVSFPVHVNPWTTHMEVSAFADVVEMKNGFFIEPLVNSQLIMIRSNGQQIPLSPRAGENCTNGKVCKMSRYGSLRFKPGAFGDEDMTIALEVGAVRTQANHNGKPITGTHYVKAQKCGLAIQTLGN